MDTAAKFITPGIIFFLTLAFGVWLSKIGKPLNTVIFTTHKLIALAAVIFTGITIYSLIKNVQIHLFVIALITGVGLCVLALFTTGALLSLDIPIQKITLIVHRVAPLVAVICMAIMIYLISGGKP
jgi:hypothetical protein